MCHWHLVNIVCKTIMLIKHIEMNWILKSVAQTCYMDWQLLHIAFIPLTIWSLWFLRETNTVENSSCRVKTWSDDSHMLTRTHTVTHITAAWMETLLWALGWWTSALLHLISVTQSLLLFETSYQSLNCPRGQRWQPTAPTHTPLWPICNRGLRVEPIV